MCLKFEVKCYAISRELKLYYGNDTISTFCKYLTGCRWACCLYNTHKLGYRTHKLGYRTWLFFLNAKIGTTIV